jgi:hypothetical protein
MTKTDADRQRECRAEVLEALAELYLRLNGYFCIRNYLYHREKGAADGLRTESDLLALRLSSQREILADATVQENDTALVLPAVNEQADCLIVEVKEHAVEFNDPICKDEGWKIIASAIQMFGALPPEEFGDEGTGTVIAKDLHKQVKRSVWQEIPTALDHNNKRLCVRMPVFGPSAAKNAASRKFVSLDHALEFVQKRMRPGEACSPYSRGEDFSPWRGTTKRIVAFLDKTPTQKLTVTDLLTGLCACRPIDFDQSAPEAASKAVDQAETRH